ncbi:MAG: hypothetical protein NTU53_04230 [Planctomycetota bacterium]|nr:hypothetical protein [Planctomycetota bacterium]
MHWLTQWFGRRSGGGLAGVSQPAGAIASSVGAETVAAGEMKGAGAAGYGTDRGRIGRVDIDSDRYEITLRLSYTSAIICGFAIVTLVGAAFIAGRKMVMGPRPAFAANTTPQLRMQPPSPEVLKLERKLVEVAPVEADGDAAKGQGATEAKGGGTGTRDRSRTKGLNYVIIQSYPDEKMAGDAVKVLAENGIDCTIEKGVPGWARWYVVMGLEGFDRLSSNPRYEAYTRKVREISDKYAKKSSFKAFAPTAYLWGKAG